MTLARRSTDLISPRAHARFDLFVFPVMLGLAAWAARRSKRAAALILANALGEGTTASLTKYDAETGLFPFLSFRSHVRIGQVGGPIFLALSCFVPGVPQPERGVLIFLGVLPIVLNGLSDISGQRSTAA
ncbi:hypothetical protein [Hymenobacter sp. B1770]|uniref:hypothetical protein n=1 Tax=Hymenobacter sp. B1770 TaxID=1718788 RepID=UPI003CF538C0